MSIPYGQLMMKNKKLLYLTLMILIIIGIGLFLYLRSTRLPPIEKKISEKVDLSNPATVYCKNLGYQVKGNLCIFPDDTTCDQWSFFRGKCGQKFTFCEQQGFRIENRIDNMGSWTAEYAVCIFDDNSECLEQDYFEGKCNPSQCKKWKMSEGGCISNNK